MYSQNYLSSGKKPYQQFQFRCIVPKDLEVRLGTREFRIALKSSLYSHSKIISLNLYQISRFIFSEIRNGYMKEALKLLIPSLFVDLRLNRIEAATLEENIASKNLLKKIGFKKEGVLRKYLKINGAWRDHILYGLLENDFK